MRCKSPIRRWTTLLLALFAPLTTAVALEPDEVALVCNAQVAASPQLAAFYAQTRGVPATNIIELSLPQGEQMGAERFDPDVVQPIRKALLERGLRDKVKCLVTFYGVPLKLAPRTNNTQEKKELADLQSQSAVIEKQITAAVTSLEDAVIRHDASYRPEPALDLIKMLRRAEVALAHGQRLLGQSPDPAVRAELEGAMLQNIRQLGGPPAIVRNTRPAMLRNLPATGPTTTMVTDPEATWRQMEQQVLQARRESEQLIARPDKAEFRQRLRELTEQSFGLVELLRLVQTQMDYLTPEAMTATDSELSLLWYDAHTHRGMLPNPLHYRAKDRDKARAVMVMRLDGPQSGTARDIFLACKAVESRGGLAGRFAIDSRGMTGRKASGEPDAYGVYDEKLRDLAALLQRSAKLPIVLDTSGDVFKAGSVSDVALYCGWYSVRNYVPALALNPGAIGFHIGSFEMISLRGEQEKGWVRGLLNDGIASTLGPVDEPYLAAFPDPMEFFPLLLTGKYSLAETYWLTLPTVSWKMSVIGDPLYAPFKAKPALKPEDLPQPLRNFVAPATAQPEHLPGYQGF